MPPLRYVIPAIVVTGLMVVASGLLLWRWRSLDRGGRWFALAALVSLVAALVQALGLAGRYTRGVFEVQTLAETGLTLLAFASWQPRRGRRLLLAGLVPAYALFWVWAQGAQGLDSYFSTLSAPMAHLLRVGAAALTLVTLVPRTREAWTDHLWFWACLGIMLVYGSQVMLDPLWQRAWGVRADLVYAAYLFHQVISSAGWILIANGATKAGAAPVRVSGRLQMPAAASAHGS